MNIIVDGKIFQDQKFGSISRIYHEILPKICAASPNISLQIFCDFFYGDLKQPLPSHQQITPILMPFYSRSNLPNKVINKLLRELWLMKENSLKKAEIWHSTYFTLPHTNKIPYIVSVYDMISELFIDEFPSYEGQSLIKKKSIDVADRIITISETTKIDLCNWYNIPEEKVISIPLAASSIFKPLQTSNIYMAC